MLDQLDGAVARPGLQPPRRSGERLPDPVFELLQQRTSPRGRSIGIRAGTTRVSFTTASSPQSSSGRSLKRRCLISARPIEDEQTRFVPPCGRMLRDQLAAARSRGPWHASGGRVILAVCGPGSNRSGDGAGGCVDGRADATGDLESVLERAREGLEALAVSTAEFEESLPEKVGAAVRDGMGNEVRPVARQLAEVRGLMNQVLRRLERLEGDVRAERHARASTTSRCSSTSSPPGGRASTRGSRTSRST